MAERVAPSALRWLIGIELARYRRDAGLTLAALAGRTGISKQKLGHLETGERTQFPGDIATVLAACGAAKHDLDRLTSLATLADSSTWWGAWSAVVPDWLRTFVGLEALAVAEFVFAPIVVPGLVQTEDYARELTAGARRVRPDHTERVVQFRMARAHRLLQEGTPLRLHAVVTEQALRLRVGSAAVMRAQYAHLLALAERPNVTLQVLPPDAGPHPAVSGQFILLDFAAVRSIAYTELQDGAVYHNDPDQVDNYAKSARILADEVAPSPADSRELITDAMERIS